VSLKRIALTIGDPAGIGPEIALRVASDWSRESGAALILIGDERVLKQVAAVCDLPCPPVIEASSLESIDIAAAIISLPMEEGAVITPGQWTAETGEASYRWVCFAIEAATIGAINAIVTGPIQKEAWHAAWINYPGHTELLAAMTATNDYRMMLTAPELSCVLVTIHVPLADVAASLTIENVYTSIRLAAESMTRKLGRAARVTVCGLNPHAGEHGMFSYGEEERVIIPAIEKARSEGMTVRGPLPPDTAFVRDQRKATDVYVCMYHDQGLIPLKAIAFDDAVNVTLGLPIIRTSVDHGTAMDIAWQGVASASSLRAAIAMAIDLS